LLTDTRARKLFFVRILYAALSLLLVASACGDSGNGSAGSGGTGGDGGDGPSKQTSYALSCRIDDLVLELPIDLSYTLDAPLSAGGSTEMTFSAVFTFPESATEALIDANVDKIDIISLSVGSRVSGATPATLGTSLAEAPINDFDLRTDTDDNGGPGPHALALSSVRTPITVDEAAERVELSLTLEQVSALLGDFLVPNDCTAPTLVGVSASFPVSPAN